LTGKLGNPRRSPHPLWYKGSVNRTAVIIIAVLLIFALVVGLGALALVAV